MDKFLIRGKTNNPQAQNESQNANGNYEFVFIAHLMKIVLGLTNSLSQFLQQKDQNIVEAMSLISRVKRQLQTLRESGWDELLEDVSSFCSEHNIQSIENLVLDRKQPGSREAYERRQARRRFRDSLYYLGTKRVVYSYSLKKIREEKEKNNESSRVASGSSGNRETVTVAPGSTDNVKTVTVFPNEVDLVVPRKSDKVMIMGGPYLGATGKLIAIDDMDGYVKLDDTLLVQIFDMAILTKHA